MLNLGEVAQLIFRLLAFSATLWMLLEYGIISNVDNCYTLSGIALTTIITVFLFYITGRYQVEICDKCKQMVMPSKGGIPSPMKALAG